MELRDKTYTLVHADGTDAFISDLSNLKVLINDFDYDLFMIPKEEGSYPFIHKPELNGNELTGESLFELFELGKDGYLHYDGIPVCFYDAQTEKQILISSVRNVPFLASNFMHVEISDEDKDKFLSFIKKAFEQSVEDATKDVKIEEKPIEVSIPVTETPATETPSGTTNTETKVEAPATNSAPEINAEAAKQLSEQTVAQAEEAQIPQSTIDQYNEHRDLLLSKGYKEASYKNYRFFINPESSDGSDAFLLMLTVAGCFQVRPLSLYDSDDENIFKYKFKIDGNKKSMYYNHQTGDLQIKKPKKHEEKAASVEVNPVEQK